MTTTQLTEFENKEGMRLTIHDDAIVISTPMAALGFQFASPEKAHRAALAIFTGPGKVDPTVLGKGRTVIVRSVDEIACYFADLDARAAAAAEAGAAELRAEALRYYNIRLGLTEDAFMTSFPEGYESGVWIDVAREARRLHKEAQK